VIEGKFLSFPQYEHSGKLFYKNKLGFLEGKYPHLTIVLQQVAKNHIKFTNKLSTFYPQGVGKESENFCLYPMCAFLLGLH
jgi:hypothetical protein